jgi:hypothetical protein
MKNQIILCAAAVIAACTISSEVKAQSWQTSNNKLFTAPDTTKVGIGITDPTERLHINQGALKIGNSSSPTARSMNMLKFGDADYVQIGEWETDDMLSFKANKYNFTNGNVGIGVSNPQYKLDVNGKMFLHTYDTYDDLYSSYLYWQAHRLVMGVPAGTYAYTRVDIVPGGSSQGELCSQFCMYHAYSETEKTENIRLASRGKSWINNDSYIGLGTDDPLYKLDVRGTIRADEILVSNVNGADFVFDNSYILRPLTDVHKYIQEHQHLPEIPSAEEMQQKGVNMNELQMQLLQKIEELTLYIIQQEQRIRELESQISK